MTTAITTAQDGAISAQTLEGVVVGGDLSRLSPAQRLEWYKARCDAAGLDPRTQPFQYITLQGKLTLYATKAATDQLIAGRRLTVTVADRRYDKEAGIYEVVVRVTFPNGQQVEDMAVLSVAGLKGDALCNAMMKCMTKAKRRTVLSACGLGALDESETETIPGAQRAAVSIETGVIEGQVGGAAKAEEPKPAKEGISQKQRERLFAIAKEKGVSQAGVKSLMEANQLGADETGDVSTARLTASQYEALCDELIPAEGERLAAERAAQGQVVDAEIVEEDEA